MAKNIVFCADGTWNSPDQDENKDELPDPTNVYKLFLRLAGDLDCLSLLKANEQEKEQIDGHGQVLQVAKYLHGVGDSDNLLNRVLGGVFGAGVISRIVRGYTFISRHYTPGDRIFLIGFSRGAYTARALGGLIASQGLLKHAKQLSPAQAYSQGTQAWRQYHGLHHSSVLAHLADFFNVATSWWHAEEALSEADLCPVEHIAAIAVWDTVGAMGLPAYAHGQRADTFSFTNRQLSPKVERGLHAVALDEQRQDFAPTLWEPASNVTQVLFPGAHADVGGGYSNTEEESGLSDIALDWMIQQLKVCGLHFVEDLTHKVSKRALWPVNPNPAGVAHQPWAQGVWEKLPRAPREFQAAEVALHRSVNDRRIVSPVRPAPDAAPEHYAPSNLPS
jgi:uncharacterized protein (DUF2235 family)